MTVWVNDDGLHVVFGQDRGKESVAGTPIQAGADLQYIIELEYDQFPAFGDAAGLYGQMPNAPIPAGAIIMSAELQVDEAFAGATATLDLGLVERDGTEIDYDGLFDGVAVTDIDAVGDTVTGAGALIGTKLSETGYPAIDVGTADFTAGRGRVVVNYRMPIK